MAKFADLLTYHTEVFMVIPKTSDMKAYEPRDDNHLPFIPDEFVRKTAYQNKHDASRWFNRERIRFCRPSNAPSPKFYRRVLLKKQKRAKELEEQRRAESIWTVEQEKQDKKDEEDEEEEFTSVERRDTSAEDTSESIEDEFEFDESEFVPEEPEATRTWTTAQKYYKQKVDQLEAAWLHAVHRQIPTYHMDLQYVSMHVVDFKAVSLTIMMCHQITRLDLTECRMEDSRLSYLCDLLIEVETITDLILRNNQLVYRQVKRLINILRDKDTIQYLDLSANGLRDDSALAISRYLEGSSSLYFLLLSRNYFSEEAAKYLGNTLATNNYLRSLDLSWNKMFRRDGARIFLRGISRNHNLETLDISWNLLGDSGAPMLKKVLSDNDELRHLNLVGTGITEKGLRAILAGLQKNQGVETLKLFHNPIFVGDIGWFLQGILELTESPLYHVDFSGFTFYETDAKLVDELYIKHVDVWYAGVYEYSRNIGANSLTQKMARTKKRIEYEDMIDGIRALRRAAKEKLTEYYVEKDMQAVEKGEEASFFLKTIIDGFVTQRSLAIRILSEELELEEAMEEVLKEEMKPTSERPKVHLVNTCDPMDLHKLRNYELQREYDQKNRKTTVSQVG